MNSAGSQRSIAAVSLTVAAVVLVVLAVWGYNAATAPIQDDDPSGTSTTTAEETCAPGEVQRIIETLRTNQVVVSVYNAGKKSGRADATLNLLEERNFLPGAIGNATDSEVTFVEIHAKAADQTKAELVALNFGKKASIVIESEADLRGPGVNVIIGDKFRKLAAGARQIRLPEPVVTCE